MLTLKQALETEPEPREYRQPAPVEISIDCLLDGRGTVEVGIYYVTLERGGSEEGGWYYDHGDLLRKFRVRKCKALDFAQRIARNMRSENRTREYSSVLCGWEYRVVVGENLRSFPERRPRYE